MLDSKLLKSLCDTYGPPGFEEKVSDFIVKEIKDYVDEIHIDNLGNLIARKKGTGKKVMFAAHMDHLGLMVEKIDDNGFLKFVNVGTLFPLFMISQRVVFESGVIGVVCSSVDVRKRGNEIKITLDDLYIDIGTTNKGESEKLVTIGDVAVFDSELYETESCFMHKALDDRIGCYVLIEAIKSNIVSDDDIYFVFTVQEEVGLKGGATASYIVDPDIGFSVDVTDVIETSGFVNVSFDKGVALKLRSPSFITPKYIKELLIDVCNKNDITYQLEIFKVGGADAEQMQLAKNGAKVGGISIPTKYVHTSNEMVSKFDVEETIKLIKGIISHSNK